MKKSYTFNPIGVIDSCFKEKFGIPRQPGLITQSTATLRLFPEFADSDSIRALDGFSHLWLIFVFHATPASNKTMVRPPRLGGNQRVGIFASRSPFRPNPIGQSLVKIDQITQKSSEIEISLIGADLLDQTPVLDIKPYIPYADCAETAKSAYADHAPIAKYAVQFSLLADQQCKQRRLDLSVNLHQLIQQILEQDPRPAYKAKQADSKIYSMKLYDFDLRWRYLKDYIEVIELA